jgi:hypothetical protein
MLPLRRDILYAIDRQEQSSGRAGSVRIVNIGQSALMMETIGGVQNE